MKEQVQAWARTNLDRGTLAALLPALALLLWWQASRHAWVAPQVLPAPATVLITLEETAVSGELWHHLGISLTRVLSGFCLGSVVGLSLGAGMGYCPTFKDYLYPGIKALAQVPNLAWLPLLMLWLGVDEALKLVLIGKATAIPVALNTLRGLEGVPRDGLELARVLRLSPWQRLRYLDLPAALGPIFTGLRYGLTQAWLVLVVAELLASSEGLGFMIVYGRQLFQADRIIVGVLAVGLVGYALDLLLARLARALSPWRQARS